MLNIAEFLASGETSLFSARRTLSKAAAALVLPLAIASLTGCAVGGTAPYSNIQASPEYQPHTSNLLGRVNAFANAGAQLRSPIAKLHIESDGNPTTYSVDGNSLLLQAMIDPSLKKIKAVSSTSEFFDQFLSAQPAGIKGRVINQDTGLTWGKVPAESLAKALFDSSPDGVTLPTQIGPDIACIILSVGTKRHQLSNGEISTFVDASESLYVVSGSANDSFISIHEATHCYPNAPMELGTDHISEGYKSSIRETRSDLATVLYSASVTGSFKPGVDMVTALRSNLQDDLSHVTVELLDAILKNLNPKDYIGMPVHEVIASAVQIVSDLHPATNPELRSAFAHDAWTNVRLAEFWGRQSSNQEASDDYATFAGHHFSVDLKAYASRTFDRSLDNAIANADTVRASMAMPLSRIADFARDLGYVPNAQQWAKAAFVDGNITPVGTKVSPDGTLVVQDSPFSMSGLEHRVRPQLGGMMAQGAVTPSNARFDIERTAEGQGGAIRPQGLRDKFDQGLGALGRALNNDSGPSVKSQGPRF
jgi:hypothetical protein